jgi:hypothetical protein
MREADREGEYLSDNDDEVIDYAVAQEEGEEWQSSPSLVEHRI